MFTPEPNSVLPHLILASVVAVGGLITLNMLPEGDDEDLTTPVVATVSIKRKPISKDFYEILKANEVVIKDTNYVSTPKNAELDYPTLLQISAFGDKKHANSLAAKLKKAGLTTVRVITRSNDRGQVHLVRTQPYARYDELKAALQIAERFNQHPLKIQIK
jgi:cell division septation protein DedD